MISLKIGIKKPKRRKEPKAFPPNFSSAYLCRARHVGVCGQLPCTGMRCGIFTFRILCLIISSVSPNHVSGKKKFLDQKQPPRAQVLVNKYTRSIERRMRAPSAGTTCHRWFQERPCRSSQHQPECPLGSRSLCLKTVLTSARLLLCEAVGQSWVWGTPACRAPGNGRELLSQLPGAAHGAGSPHGSAGPRPGPASVRSRP